MSRFASIVGKVLTVGGLVGSSLSAWGVTESRKFRLRRIEVPILPEGAAPIKVLHISDIHLVPNQQSKRVWLHALGDLKPDLVINTGDNIAAQSAIPPLLNDLGSLLKVPGFFVFGSNDYFAPILKNPFKYLTKNTKDAFKTPTQLLPFEELRQGFLAAGWIDLNNSNGMTEVGGLQIEGRGTDDAHLNQENYQKGGPSKADLLIGVTHSPYLHVLDAMVSDGVQLIFAGHTHGGQFCWPSGKAIITNCDLDVGRVKGLSTHHVGQKTGQAFPKKVSPTVPLPQDSAWLHVSGGIGSSPYVPIRLFNRPEATLLTLLPTAADPI